MKCKDCPQREGCDLAIKDLDHPDIKCNKYKTVDNRFVRSETARSKERTEPSASSSGEAIERDYATVEESYNKVQLPCLPGDDIYWIDEHCEGAPKIRRDPAAVEAVCYYGNGDFRVICHGDSTPERIGTKFCYLTREDAERGLREMRGEK